MLVCRHPNGSTRNVWVKNFFDARSWNKTFFSHKYIILAMLTLENKVNSLFFHLYHFLIARVGFTRLRYTRPSNKLLEGLFDPGTFFYCFRKYREIYVYVALLWMFVWSVYLSAFLVILGDFCEAKFIRITSLIFPIVIWSYVTPFPNWRQKDK